MASDFILGHWPVTQPADRHWPDRRRFHARCRSLHYGGTCLGRSFATSMGQARSTTHMRTRHLQDSVLQRCSTRSACFVPVWCRESQSYLRFERRRRAAPSPRCFGLFRLEASLHGLSTAARSDRAFHLAFASDRRASPYGLRRRIHSTRVSK